MRHKMLFTAMAAGTVVGGILIGCASYPGNASGKSAGGADVEAKAVAMMKTSFLPHGQAKLDRLDQDETQKLCSEAMEKAPPPAVVEKVQKINLAMIKWPADGKYLGDWKSGEKIAQLGQGMQFSDDPTKPSGANCYACHQLTKEEVSYGTIGPPLYNFAKLRGYGPDIQKYAYGKIYNAEAYAACTNMPRFGHKGILTEAQIQDVVALLMDPQSPVNK
ncbi:MAG: sulfur oxidation c-type cytochrome SoxX [Casimicrobiaceae bacterium]